jgi:hypothetical protein
VIAHGGWAGSAQLTDGKTDLGDKRSLGPDYARKLGIPSAELPIHQSTFF